MLLLALACLFSAGLPAQIDVDEPVKLVEDIAGKIFADVTENIEKYTENQEGLKLLVRRDLMPLLDVKYASRLILGRAGKGLDQAKIDEFATVMTNLLVDRYSAGLLYFNSEVKLQVLPQRGDLNEKLTHVRTRVSLPKGGEAPVDYAFHKTPDGWKAFDVIVEGISYITTYRNQIMPEVQDNGIDSVIDRLGKGELNLAD
jgi:phospholipid transport system substrate-binding protein